MYGAPHHMTPERASARTIHDEQLYQPAAPELAPVCLCGEESCVECLLTELGEVD